MNIKARFDSDPTFRYDVEKAWYAYHAGHYVYHKDTHNFAAESREAICNWCTRSREMVRWDDLPASCSMRPKECNQAIEKIIFREEEKFLDLMTKAEATIPAILNKTPLDGKLLGVLHFTHGFYPEIVEFFTDSNIDINIMQDYEIERLAHVKASKNH